MAKQHNYYGTRIYRIWSNMKDRCNHPRGNRKFYYDKKVKYDPAWEDFRNFLKDMKEGYSDSKSLDRINGDQGYSKENCRWVTRKLQAKNRKSTHLFKFQGKSLMLVEWAKLLKMKRSTLAQRIYVYKWDIEKAFTFYLKQIGK